MLMPDIIGFTHNALENTPVIGDLIKVLEPISKICSFLLDPMPAINSVWVTIAGITYSIVIIAGIVTIVMYALGHKEALKYSFSLPILYAILKYLTC